jgi:hypothetical protein
MRFAWTLIVIFASAFAGEAQPAAATGDQYGSGSLLEYKLELASQSVPYIHVTSDGVLVYFRNLLLKKFTVEDLTYSRRFPLRMSRIAGWWPLVEAPQWKVESSPPARGVETARILHVNDMPERYWIALVDGALLRISSGSPPETQPPSIPEELQSGVDEFTDPATTPVISVRLTRNAAQGLYWLIQSGTGVVY